MKKLFCLNIVLFLLQISIYPQQNFWEQTKGPYGAGHIIYGGAAKDGKLFIGRVGYGYGLTLYSSYDTGKSFSYLNTGLSNTSIGSILIDGYGNIFAGDNVLGGIFRSTDNGNNWDQVLSAGQVYAIISDTSGSIFAATGKGIFRSSDNGNNWDTLKIGRTIGYIFSLASDNNERLFLSGYDYNFNIFSIYSVDNGKTWDSLSIPANDFITSFAFGQNQHIMASFNSFNDSLGILISDNSGLTWISNSLASGNRLNPFVMYHAQTSSFFAIIPSHMSFLKSTDFGRTWATIPNVISSNENFLFNQNGYLFACGNSGLLRSTDMGKNWVQEDSGIFVASSDYLTLFPNKTIYTETADRVYRLDNIGMNWIKDDSALAGSFIVSNSGDYFLSNGTVSKSTDKGKTWKIVVGEYDTGILGKTKELTELSNGYILCGGGWSDGEDFGFKLIWESTDDGETWNRVYGFSTSGLINTIASEPDNVVLAAGGNTIVRSTDLGTSWSSANNGLPTSASCNVIRVRVDGAAFLGTQSSGMFKSIDEGLSWQSINNGLNSLIVNSISINNEGMVLIGTNDGVFEYVDNINKWLPLNAGLFDLSVSSVLCDSSDYLYAATRNSGVFRSVGPVTSVNVIKSISRAYLLLQNYPNPFNPTTTIEYSVPKFSLVTLKVYDILGREVATLVNEEKHAGNYKVVFNAKNLSSGVYFYRLHSGSFAKTKKLILMK